MELLPPGERPVREQEQQQREISPETLQRLHSLLRELYKQRPAWRSRLEPVRVPSQGEIRARLKELRGVTPLQGAKVLYLDDVSQGYLPFLTDMTLATRRRVERIFYHGETADEIAQLIRERLRRCPQPHLLIADEQLDMLPSLEYAGHTELGHEVVDRIRYDLEKQGIPAVLYSIDDQLADTAASVGAKFVCKTIPPKAAVEQMARIFRSYCLRIQRKRELDERFFTSD